MTDRYERIREALRLWMPADGASDAARATGGEA